MKTERIALSTGVTLNVATAGTAGAPPQRHLRAQQPKVRGVVVGGLERLLLRRADRCDASGAGQVREGEGLVGLVLALDLDVLGGHGCHGRQEGAGQHPDGRPRRAADVRAVSRVGTLTAGSRAGPGGRGEPTRC